MRALRSELSRCSIATAEASHATKYATAAALNEPATERIGEILAHNPHPQASLTAHAPRWRQPDPEAAGRYRETAPRTSHEVAIALGCALVGRLPGEVSMVPTATAPWRRLKRADITPPAPRVRPAQSVINKYQLSVSGELLRGYGERPEAERQPRPQHRPGSTATAEAVPPTPLPAGAMPSTPLLAGATLPTLLPAAPAELCLRINPGGEIRSGSVSDADVRRLVRQASRSDAPPPRRQPLGSPPKQQPIKRPTTAPATRPVHTVNYHSSRWAGVESRALDLAGAYKPQARRSRRVLSAEDLEHGQPSAGLTRHGQRHCSTSKYGTKRAPGGWLEPTTAWGVPVARPYVTRRR
jgi:hypothetical protein